jgi:alpha-mannosidase
VQDIFLGVDAVRVDFHLHAEWYERDCCLKVAFPVAVTDSAATFEAPFGVSVGPDDGTETPAQQWVDVSGAGYGASLLNNCRYAFDVNGNVLRMTALRGIPDLDPRADEGIHDLDYALYPHPGDWRAAKSTRQGLAFNFPLLARQELKRTGVIAPWGALTYPAKPPALGFLTLEPDNIVLTALKVEEDEWGQWSPIIVRMVETEGRETDVTLTFFAPLAFCEATNHLEDRIERADFAYSENRVRIHFRPYEIRTFRVAMALPDYDGVVKAAVDGAPPVEGLNPEGA